ncbi:MAG: Fic family protein [Opitutaceae bacterium]
MRYIHQHPNWPRFTWNERALLSLLPEVRHRQGRLLGRMEGLGFRFRSEAGLDNLTSEVIKSSAIEGTVFDPTAVRSSIARRLGLGADQSTRSSHEIEGAVEMMLDATQNYSAPLTADRLLGWQSSLFPAGRSGVRRILVGQWRTPEMDPMQVVPARHSLGDGGSGPLSRDRIRKKHIHFEAPTADRLSVEVEAFLRWFESADAADPILRAAIAHLWFVTIHPFEDGNGRVSRAIADLALARADGSPLRFYTMSTQIESEKKAYYDALEQTQKGDTDITGWLVWFLSCLDRALTQAEHALASILQKSSTWERINAGVSVSERQRTVINALLAGANPEISTSRYAKLAHCSLDTALRDIQSLVTAGVLVAGDRGGRSTHYRLA